MEENNIDINPVSMQDRISYMEDNIPKDKRSKLHKKWIQDINELMKMYNKNFNKIYKIIK